MKQTVPEVVRRFLALMLCAAMLLPMVAVPGHAEEITDPVAETTAPTEAADGAISALTEALATMNAGEEPLAVVYAASDFQLKNSAGNGDDVSGARGQMEAIVNKIKETYPAVDGALFCGDYSAYYNTWTESRIDVSKNNAGIDAVAAVLDTAWGLTDEDVIYVQGNHDPANTKRLETETVQDFGDYLVFVMHEDDFQWDQGKAASSSGNEGKAAAESAAQSIAEELETFLQGQVNAKDDRPVFITAHVPLHFGYRTVKNSDNIYAKYVFDVLNDYGKKLDIIFLFGHDHSSTYDDYLGGGAVYLPAGDKLRVPDLGSSSSSTEYTLTFTYMNAGYLGYYEGACETGLSSTVFEIYDDKVVIARYDEDGLANLKDKGVKASTDDWTGAEANTTVYESTQDIDPLKTFHEDLVLGALASGKMLVGNTGELTVSGLYNTTYDVAWSTSDEGIVSVAPSADGMSATLTANGVGTAKITAVATETGKIKSVGDVSTLEYTVEVVDTTAGNTVVLLEAGEHTFFKKVDAVEIGKTYAFIDLEDEGYVIGQQQALHFNNKIDEKKEGDVAGTATTSVNQELNASGEEVFQLPVGGELLTLADITNKNCWWVADVAKEDGNVGGTIRTYTDRTYGYLFAIEGDGDFLTRDADQDRIATGDETEASSTGGAHWYYDAEHGLVTNHKTDGFQFALYYSQANTDFSAYRINHNGAHGDSKFNENGTLANEEPKSRVYAFEQTTITLANPITAQLNDTTGYVNKDVGYTDDDNKRRGGAQTGDTIILNNGTMTVEIPVTIDMLSGTFDVTAPGTYTGLTVTYAGVVISDNYTLEVNDSATILKNHAAREYMDTIYTRVDKWYPGRQYLIVDTDEEGIGHAMGVTSGKVTAHNVLVQEIPVDGKDMVYIDSTRYSDKADTTAANLVGRDITDQGNINEYLNATITKQNYYDSVALVWNVAQRFFPTDGSPEISDVRNKDYYFLQSQMQIAKNEANRTLYIGANAEDTQLKLGSQAETAGKETDDPAGATLDWWWELWQYSTSTGVHLTPKQVNHAYLFYNWQNVDGSNDTSNAANKNFQTEEATSGDFTLNTYRRVWIYERVTSIDTISARISDKSAHVSARVEGLSEGTNNATFTGDYILVDTTHADGTVTTEQVPVTISMLSGTYDLTEAGTYPNLTVTYQGQAVCDDYTLIVDKFVANDYPEFPNEGAVRIDKQLDTTKYSYLSTGVASIDLSVTGIPAQTGVDLVVILDASSSMQNCPHGSFSVNESCGTCGTVSYNETRMGLMEATLESMLKQLQVPINGYAPDVDVAIATFNGYTPINTDYEFWYSGTKSDGTGSNLNHNSGQQTEEERPDASEILLPFTGIEDVDPSFKNVNTTGRDIAYNKGTNYDRAMELAYQLLKEKQELNALNGTNREAVVIFMSDGAPYQYNYFHGDPNVPSWANFLSGTLTASSIGVTNQSVAVQSAFKKYDYHIANGGNANKHWLAEALKGDPNQKYTIIDRHAMTTDHMTKINGLGATMYTIGFGLAADHVVTYDICTNVLKNMASDTDHYIAAADGDALEAAFSKIAGEVRSAGNAVFKDQMGQYFDLVTSNKINIINDVGEEEVVDLTGNKPTITVKTYALYKRSEIGKTVDGVVVTETMVGSRKTGEPTVLETITFSDDGSVVSSDKKSGNILNGKVIEASTFFYNTDTVNPQNITVNGKTISLEPETFYWNVGNIPEEELVLSYSVYLNGSMEGTRPQGTYDTNKYAELTYTNYLGNNCKLSAPTPKLPWNQGTVGYAFYLVNSKGEPIVNQSTGEVGSFENSVKITEAVYKDFYLNSVGEDIMAEVIEADNVMPEGYTLFDTGAKYEVMLDSNGTGYYVVTVGTDVNGITTTYVQGVDSSAIKPVGHTDTENYVTANTIVWFAVVAETKAVPDVVVIDYGLPVDINVLYNDTMMGDYGKLAYVGPISAFTEYNESTDGKLWEYLQNNVAIVDQPKFKTETVNGENGVITVQKSEGESTGILRYTLNESNGMKMKDEETFVYAVKYTGGIGAKGYYYSTVTIIPATSIYYEDNFVEYVVKDYETAAIIKDEAVQWTQVGIYGEVTQAEDRPGEYSPGKIDANNIYGYDGAYTDMAEYSMNNYHKVTVGKQTLSNGTDVVTYANATFSFSGTGFDIVSVTSDKTGTIVVKVNGIAAADGSTVSKNYMVDTYYGFYFDEGNWIVDTDDTYPEDKNALYQIPVIKVADLPYGDYDVTISASHKELYDHGQYDGTKYDFYLDAIRIYDPANDGEGNKVIEDAYKADGEGWPSYQELRNMVISAEDFNALKEGDQTNGLIFIDNTGAQNGKEYSISDYKSYGPNNELYLAPGQAVSFVLEAGKYTENGATMYGKNIAGIHLALKSVNGDTIAKIFDGEKFKAEEVSGDEINTATDLYYDITDLNGKVVVIYNAGNSILSITNIKTTYLSDPMGQNATVLMMSRGAASVALLSLNPVDNEPEVPETSEPEVPETSKPDVPETSEPDVPETSEPEENEEFEPAKFRISLDKNKAKVGDTVVITVTTSRDVDHITVNGEQITKYSTNFRKTERTWRVRVKLEEVGQLEVSVVCYDKDENASAPATKIIEVTEKNNGSQGSGTGSSLRELLDLFFGFLR